MAQGAVVIDLKAENRDLKQGLQESKGLISSFSSSASVALGVVGSALALAGAAAGVVQLRDLYDTQADAEANLQHTLEGTGHAAGFTIDQLKQYASQLQEVTNFGDEVILSGQRILATFENIKGDEFKRVTELALDMAEATGGDAAASMESLGRALNDPLRGMMRLRAEGVALTDEQAKMVESMVEAGDVAGAQGVLLDELSKKYGGIARNAADPWDQFWNKLGDRGEQAFAIIAPIFDAFMGLLGEVLDFIEPVGTTAEEMVGDLVDFAQETYAAWQPVFDWLGDLLTKRFVAMQMTLETIGDVAVDTWSMISGAVDVDGAAILEFFQNFFDWANDMFIAGLFAMQVAIENWQDVVGVAVLGAALGIVSSFEDVKHLFTVTVPEALDWFTDHWHEVFEDLAAFTGTIFNNLIHNAEQFVSALGAVIQGKDFTLELRGITEGFESQLLDKLPDFTERELTATEESLRQQVGEMTDRLGAAWDAKYDELERRRKEIRGALGGDGGEEYSPEAGAMTDYALNPKDKKEGGGGGGGGGGSAFEDITSLYDRIAGSAMSVGDEATVAAIGETTAAVSDLASRPIEFEVDWSAFTKERDETADAIFALRDSVEEALGKRLDKVADNTKKIADKKVGLA